MNPSYNLILKNHVFEVPKIKETIVAVSKPVADELLNENKYYVKSDVSEEVFLNFLEYWKNQEKIPIIDNTNFIEYQKLDQEFGMLSDLLLSKTTDPLFNLSCVSQKLPCNKCNIEASISRDLDLYIDRYPSQMSQIPIQSLFNIFHSENRILHDHIKACDFILNNTNSDLLILAKLIASNKYTELRNKINNEKITYVEFPDHITDIPDFAFFKCTTIQKVVTSIQLKVIGKYAFFGCHSLTNIFVPETVETVGKGAFSGCFKLKKINLPNIKRIEQMTFEECKSLILNLPKEIEFIASDSFVNCSSIEELIFPESCTQIDWWSFCICKSLKKIHLPSKLTEIKDGTFSNCNKLEEIEIPPSLTHMGNHCFSYCSSLKRIVIPSNVNYLGSNAFEHCTSLVEVSFQNKLNCIKDSTFCNCEKLVKIELPQTVTKIENSSFNSCKSLTEIQIPFETTEIGWGAFANCTSLHKVTIPKRDISINCAFFGCPNLKEVEILKSSNSYIRCYCFDISTKINLVEK
ncbi:hypothetical protein M9Y10_014671 [Tritrichomonas musculus]|uniref:Uncharacterized protein n=1 Tax=Tritrichomonas musculus TaxID=1915356 RepID=A0ABR2L055_9EUKA